MMTGAIIFIAGISFFWALLSLRKAKKAPVKKEIKEHAKSRVVFQAQNDSSSSSLKPEPTE